MPFIQALSFCDTLFEVLFRDNPTRFRLNGLSHSGVGVNFLLGTDQMGGVLIEVPVARSSHRFDVIKPTKGRTLEEANVAKDTSFKEILFDHNIIVVAGHFFSLSVSLSLYLSLSLSH